MFNNSSRESSIDILQTEINTNNKRNCLQSNVPKAKRIQLEDSSEIDELALIINKNNKPTSYKEAINSNFKTKQNKAMQAEIDQLKN